ncbi:MAG TPA: HD domain-containing phosphohydrolase [Gaiellaceae bacterium]|nr:HD domain-containing phosphohydrolase [Gaiellaceae bacterium]
MTTAKPRILIVDDDPTVRSMLSRMLGRQGYDCEPAASAADARQMLASAPFDLALCDLNMPGESGLELIEHVAAEHPDTATIMVTGADDSEIAGKALELGTYGYVIKPFYNNELLINIANALRRRRLELESRTRRTTLETAVRERTAELQTSVKALRRTEHELRQSQKETIYRLSRAAEFRDGDMAPHIESMSHFCHLLAERLRLDREFCALLLLASPLHDVGKIAIPDRILLKPGPLDAEEREVVQTHAEIGYRMLTGSGGEMLELAASIAWTHHEHFDGGGYPRGIVGSNIPVEGRIAAVADVFDALTSDRVYRPAFTIEQAVAEMRLLRGTQFDPAVLDVFLDSLEQVLEVKNMYGTRSSATTSAAIELALSA